MRGEERVGLEEGGAEGALNGRFEFLLGRGLESGRGQWRCAFSFRANSLFLEHCDGINGCLRVCVVLV